MRLTVSTSGPNCAESFMTRVNCVRPTRPTLALWRMSARSSPRAGVDGSEEPISPHPG